MKDRSLLWVQILMAIIIVIWGAAYPMIKLLLLELGPMELAVARFWISLLPLLARRGKLLLFPPTGMRTPILLGLICPGRNMQAG